MVVMIARRLDGLLVGRGGGVVGGLVDLVGGSVWEIKLVKAKHVRESEGTY